MAFCLCGVYCPVFNQPLLDDVEAFTGSRFGGGTGPIFLDELGCTGTETSLLQCNRFTGLGLHSCDHSQDAGVSCRGKENIFLTITHNK